jgi:hypothetical protein
VICGFVFRIVSDELYSSVMMESAPHQLREERFSLIGLELEGAGHDGPCGGEKKHRCGQTEEEQAPLGASARIVAVSESGCELLEGRSQRGSERFHRHGTAVG